MSFERRVDETLSEKTRTLETPIKRSNSFDLVTSRVSNFHSAWEVLGLKTSAISGFQKRRGIKEVEVNLLSIKFTGLKVVLARQNRLHKNTELSRVKECQGKWSTSWHPSDSGSWTLSEFQ